MNEWQVSSMSVHVAKTAIKTQGSQLESISLKEVNFVLFAITKGYKSF